MNIHLKQLEGFVSVVEQGSFSRAAALLYTSPAALTQQMNTLERELECRLLQRSYRGAEPTAAGRDFYPKAKEILALAAQAVRQCRAAGKEDAVITVGCYHENEIILLQDYLRRFAGICPDIQVDFYNGDYREFYDLLLAGRLDFFIHPYDDFIEKKGLCFQELGETQLCCCMSWSHPLAHKKRLSLGDLTGQALIIGCGCKSRCLDGFREHIKETGLPVRLEQFDTEGEVWKHILTQDHLLLSLYYSARSNANSTAILLDWPQRYRYGIIYRADASRPMRRFLNFMKEIASLEKEKRF